MTRQKCTLKESVWSLGGEAGLVLATQDPVRERELDLGVMELFDGWSATFVGCDHLHLHDLDGVSAGTMPGTHVTIALSDGSRCGQVSVLAVHVMGSTTGVITQPDAEVFHLERGFLMNQATVDGLS